MNGHMDAVHILIRKAQLNLWLRWAKKEPHIFIYATCHWFHKMIHKFPLIAQMPCLTEFLGNTLSTHIGIPDCLDNSLSSSNFCLTSCNSSSTSDVPLMLHKINRASSSLPLLISHRGLSGRNRKPINWIHDGTAAKPSMYLKLDMKEIWIVYHNITSIYNLITWFFLHFLFVYQCAMTVSLLNLSDCCLSLSEQFFSYILAGTSYISMRWRLSALC